MTNWTKTPWVKRGLFVMGMHPTKAYQCVKICQVIHAPGTYIQETNANIRLISSAPKLYAALNRLTQVAEDLDNGFLDSAIDEANEALAEAKK